MLASIVDVNHLVEVSGYPLLFVLVMAESGGVPIPGETALIAAAVLASRGKLQIELVIALAAAAAIVGDNIGYLIGRKGGRWLLRTPRRASSASAGRCCASASRSSNATAPRPCSSGASCSACACGPRGWPAPRACAGARSCCGTRSAASAGRPAIGLIAYFLGNSAGNAIEAFGLYGLAAVVLAIVAFCACTVAHARRSPPPSRPADPRHTEPPRAASDGRAR